MPESPAPNAASSICVIGAGPSGLVFCKNLKQAGITFECFDASRSVGGIWDVEADGVGGGYRSLQTNTSIEKMRYSDFPFPENTPDFPSHGQMLDYFNGYADHFGLRPHIRLNCRVRSADLTADGAWRITLDDGEVKDFRACIVATGQYGSRRWPNPEPPGDFDGEVIHSADYLDPVTPIDCRNKRVVVVGVGSSAPPPGSAAGAPSCARASSGFACGVACGVAAGSSPRDSSPRDSSPRDSSPRDRRFGAVAPSAGSRHDGADNPSAAVWARARARLPM